MTTKYSKNTNLLELKIKNLSKIFHKRFQSLQIYRSLHNLRSKKSDESHYYLLKMYHNQINQQIFFAINQCHVSAELKHTSPAEVTTWSTKAHGTKEIRITFLPLLLFVWYRQLVRAFAAINELLKKKTCEQQNHKRWSEI